MTSIKDKNQDFKFSKKDYILYILNRIEPTKSDKIRLNKIAFFIEFAYIFFNNKNLSALRYAAIDNGPVIDGYDPVLKEMAKEKLITIDGYHLRPLSDARATPPTKIEGFIKSIIEKYENLSIEELIALSHQTDSYKITTDNEKVMGRIIDKKLASLETFFCDSEDEEDISENRLPVVDRGALVEYEF